MTTIRSCQRDQCPGSWWLGRQMVWAGKVWQLREIDGDVYHWLEVRDAAPGDSTALLHKEATK